MLSVADTKFFLAFMGITSGVSIITGIFMKRGRFPFTFQQDCILTFLAFVVIVSMLYCAFAP